MNVYLGLEFCYIYFSIFYCLIRSRQLILMRNPRVLYKTVLVMQISLILCLVLYAFNCIIVNICVIELSKSINQSINQFYLLMLLNFFFFTYRLLIISQFTNYMIELFYINVFHSFSRCCFHYISCCQIFQLSLSVSSTLF